MKDKPPTFEDWCTQVYITLIKTGLLVKCEDGVIRPSHGRNDTIFFLGHEDAILSINQKLTMFDNSTTDTIQ